MAPKKTTKKKKRKSPVRWSAEIFEKIKMLSSLGATEAQLCKIVGVSAAGLGKWKHKYPELVETLKKSKDLFDATEVEPYLLKRATGQFFTTETRTAYNKDGEVYNKTVIRKEYPPDTKALLAWLTNRTDRWRYNPNPMDNREPPEVVRVK